jgi:hypothetical protein
MLAGMSRLVWTTVVSALRSDAAKSRRWAALVWPKVPLVTAWRKAVGKSRVPSSKPRKSRLLPS